MSVFPALVPKLPKKGRDTKCFSKSSLCPLRATSCSVNINRCPLHKSGWGGAQLKIWLEILCNLFFKSLSFMNKGNMCHFTPALLYLWKVSVQDCHTIPISHKSCYWSPILGPRASMPNLLHPSCCQKQSLQMKPKGWGNPFLLIKAKLGKRHKAGVYSLCCQWQ